MKEEPDQPDDHFGRRVANQRIFDPLGISRRNRRSGRHAAEVDDEHDDLRVRAVPNE